MKANYNDIKSFQCFISGVSEVRFFGAKRQQEKPPF